MSKITLKFTSIEERRKEKMMTITTIATALTILGALNWLLVGLFGFNLVTWIFGMGIFANIVYVIVGLAGVWLIYYLVSKASQPRRATKPTSTNK